MGYIFFAEGLLMTVPAAYSLLAVRHLLRRTPREAFLPDHLKRAVESHVEGFARLSLSVSVTVHQLYGHFGEDAPHSSGMERRWSEYEWAASSVLGDIELLRGHFTEIMARLALGGKFSELNAFIERKLTFAPEVLEFVRREGGATALLDSVARHLGRVEGLIQDRMAFATRAEVDAFSGTLLAAKLILRTVAGDPMAGTMR